MSQLNRFFDRHARIVWWQQEKLMDARVLVVGAGALGNEVIKNLALLGIGNLLIVDFDTIEDTNLSRAVLFRQGDAKNGAKKAEVAARRAKLLNPHSKSVAKAFHGDIVWEMGLGVFRYADVIVGCLDNIEARLAVNLTCRKLGKTWIDGGMWELAGSVSVYDCTDEEKACYECGMTPEHYRAIRTRYSCTNAVVKTRIQQGFEPTTQTTSALVGAFQSQEVVKLLHNIPSFSGRRLMLNGEPHSFIDNENSPAYLIDLSRNQNCLCHQETPFSNVIQFENICYQTPLQEFFNILHERFGPNPLTIDLERIFVMSADCPYCGKSISINKPLYRIKDNEVVCPDCEVICPTCGTKNKGVPDCVNCGQEDIYEPRLNKFTKISEQDDWYQANITTTLADVGVPPLQVLSILTEAERFLVELTGDKPMFWR